MAIKSDGIGGPKPPVFSSLESPLPSESDRVAGNEKSAKPTRPVRARNAPTPSTTFERQDSRPPQSTHPVADAGSKRLADGMKPGRASGAIAGSGAGMRAGDGTRSAKPVLAEVARIVENPARAWRYQRLPEAVSKWTDAFGGPEFEELALKAVVGDAAKVNESGLSGVVSPLTRMVDDVRAMLEAIA